MIRDEVLFKIRVSFDELVTRKKVLYEYNNCIDIYLNVVVKVLEVQSSVAFELCIDEEFI